MNRKTPQIWSVEIQGNYTFGDFVLNEIMTTKIPSLFRQQVIKRKRNAPLVESELKEDAQRISRFYVRRGFPEVRVSYSIVPGAKAWQQIVRFKVIEGRPVVLKDFSIVYDGPDSATVRLKKNRFWQRTLRKQPFKRGRRYETIRLGEFRSELEGALKDAGFPFATLRTDENFPTSTAAALVLFISPGISPIIDSIRISGFKSVPEHLVRRELDIRPGIAYRRWALTEAQRDLYSHHLFRYATVTIDESTPRDSVTVSVQVAERPLRSIEVRAGLGNEDLLRAQLSWTHRNLWQRAHSFSVSGKTSFIEQRGNLTYFIPYVFNNRSSVNISPFAFHLLDRSYELWSYGFNQTLLYQAGRNFTLSAGYEFTRNDESRPERVLRSLSEQPRRLYNLASLTLAAFYDYGYLTAGQGWVIQPTYQYSGFTRDTDFHFQKIALDVRNYTRIGEHTELATRLSPGLIFDVRNDTLPNSVLFYLGGANSIRGFNRQFLGPKEPILDRSGRFQGYLPSGGTAQLGFNLEIRQRAENMGRGLGIALFLDGGQVWQAGSSPAFADLQYAAGGGIRWRSPVGPVRFDVGYKLNPRPDDVNRYKGREYGYFFDRFGFHISIGQAF